MREILIAVVSANKIEGCSLSEAKNSRLWRKNVYLHRGKVSK